MKRDKIGNNYEQQPKRVLEWMFNRLRGRSLDNEIFAVMKSKYRTVTDNSRDNNW